MGEIRGAWAGASINSWSRGAALAKEEGVGGTGRERVDNPVSKRLRKLFLPTSDGPEFGREDQAQKLRAITLIATGGLLVSLLYVVVYLLLGFKQLSAYSAVFVACYLAFLFWKNPANTRLAGIVLIGGGTIQVAGLATLFLPPAGGTHTFLMVVPIFSLIAIHPKDRFWWWTFTIFSVSLVAYFEWMADSYVPPFALALLEAGDYGPWRAVSAILTLLLIVGVVNGFHRDLYLARKDLLRAYDRSESLLLSILPATIAQRLKRDQGTIADDFEDASVLFADLVGFTHLASRQSASETVAMLNTIFSAFDKAVEELGLEKIKTIGDAYMVAAGLPTPRPDHAAQLVRLAFSMIRVVSDYNADHGQTFELRVGISSGPLTAGVIGSRKFSYDIWGDTVNVASRMESTGMPGRVQVTEAVAVAAADVFDFEDRGLVEVKGKGEMRTFFVTAPPRSAEPESRGVSAPSDDPAAPSTASSDGDARG